MNLPPQPHNFNPNILLQYDIRGTFNKTLFAADALLLGERFAHFMGQNNLKTIVVARDGRLSSPCLSSALICGLKLYGIDVKDVGLGPTPLMHFALRHLGTDAGIMVTGSHNPPADNGFKITLKNRPFFGEDIKHLATPTPNFYGKEGSYQSLDVSTHYRQRLLRDYKPNANGLISGAVKPLRVAFDPGNGAGCEIIKDLIKSAALNIEAVIINSDIDGNFPGHNPDPTRAENLQQLIDCVKANRCDLGIAFDGDADRIIVVDERGRTLLGDQLMMIFARDVLSNNPGATVIADVKSTQGLFDSIKSWGGKPVMSKTGHPLIKTKIAETGALLAGEMSGHIFFADKYYGFDDGIYASIRLLNILHSSPQSLAEIFDNLPHFCTTPSVNIKYAGGDRLEIIEMLKKQLAARGINFNDIDGIRVNTGYGWWLLRVSNTEASFVVRCEAKTAKGLQLLKAELQEFITPFGLNAGF